MQQYKVYWITGASSGIGEALALKLAHFGNHLILSGRNLDNLETVKRACEQSASSVEILPFDMLSIDSFPEIVRKALSFHGKIDVLVNNAGISQRSPAHETSFETERKIMDINYFAPVALTKLLLPQFMKQGSGHIVVISSIAGKFGFPLRSSYAAAKHALQGYFEALRLELKDITVYVTLVYPGRVRTNISLNAMKADGSTHGKMDKGQLRGISATRCAKVIDRAIQHKKYEVLVGKTELIPVYLKRFFPSLFYFLIKKIKP